MWNEPIFMPSKVKTAFRNSGIRFQVLIFYRKYKFIYFLFGYENSKEVVYVGQAKKRNDGESVLKRLREHDKSSTEKYRDKWVWIVAVTNKNDAWGLDELNALEHAFYNEIPADQSLNGNNPNYGGADYEA